MFTILCSLDADFNVKFYGPKETIYEDGMWLIHVILPSDYPYKSPSIGFLNRIYHPNVDEISGSVCLDVINQTWTPMFELLNVFEVFLPQLLRYPNPSDPLNGQAAQLLLRDEMKYNKRVREYVRNFSPGPKLLLASSGTVASCSSSPVDASIDIDEGTTSAACSLSTESHLTLESKIPSDGMQTELLEEGTGKVAEHMSWEVLSDSSDVSEMSDL